MSISYVGSSTGSGTSLTLPAHLANDLILIFGFSQQPLVAPTVPAGFTSIQQLAGDGVQQTSSGSIGYRIATSSNETSGTWTTSEGLLCHVYRSLTGTLGIGASAGSTLGFSTLIEYPGLTFTNTDSTSWAVCMAGHKSNNGLINTPPATMINRSFLDSFALDAAGHDTNGVVNTFAASNVEIGGNGSSYTAMSVEITETASSVQITSVTDPLRTNGALTINGSGFETLGANSKITQKQGTRSAELADGTWGLSQIVTAGADVEATTLNYGTHTLTVVAQSLQEATTTTDVLPALNNSFTNITSLATSGDRLTAVPDLAAGDQVRYQSLLYKAGVATSYTVTVNPDATISIDSTAPNGAYTMEVKAWDSTDNTWGTAATQHLVILVSTPVPPPDPPPPPGASSSIRLQLQWSGINRI